MWCNLLNDQSLGASMKILSLLLTTISLIAGEHNYRLLDENASEQVRRIYYQSHTMQTVEFVKSKKSEYEPLDKAKMGIWEAMELLNHFKDESDPDADFPQNMHAFQTAEALRKDGCPRWLIITGFIHDLGKMLYKFGEPQWAVVGDTFPVGCAFDKEIVFHDFFIDNPDSQNPLYQTKLGVYEEGCGFSALHFSYGHDEYLYNVMKPYLPEEALYIIRFHSFYPAHREGAYTYFMDEYDQKMMKYLKLFSQCDLYSKTEEMPDIEELMPYYKELVNEFFPPEIEGQELLLKW